MAGTRVIVVGSGAGGSTAAMALATAGFDVTILEKGRSFVGDLTQPAPTTKFSNDEVKSDRYFATPDPLIEPRTFRRVGDTEPRVVGAVQNLPQTVGGATIHWDAKTPRFWDIDFKKLSLLGPVPGANVTDWPFEYDEIAPVYDEVERLIGVSGDIHQIAPGTLQHAPRTRQLPMPPGPPQLSSLKAARGCTALGLHAFPAPMAIASQPYRGRPACNDCGFCARYGCPIHARVGALAPLRRALQHGAELRERAWVTRIVHANGRATGVEWIDARGRKHTEQADLVVLGALAIETVRLALLSQLPDPDGQIGRHMMFHWFSFGTAIFHSERVHAYRGRSTTHVCDDFADPDFAGARPAAAAAGLPYFRGGTLELGGSSEPITEAMSYLQVLPVASPGRPFGAAFKQLMHSSILRDRLFGVQMIGEDLPYPTNTVDLDPSVKDYRGFPVARVTYSPGAYELAAQTFYLPKLAAIARAAGADTVSAVAGVASDRYSIAASALPDTAHVMGGMRMGTDSTTSVTDGTGRMHSLPNVLVADGGVFPTSGGHNPTLTIIAAALRNAREWAK
ncbi:MAG: GMC oxidoreductase [Candidatus Eisenbacteria bacterium]